MYFGSGSENQEKIVSSRDLDRCHWTLCWRTATTVDMAGPQTVLRKTTASSLLGFLSLWRGFGRSSQDLLLLLVFTVHLSSTTLSCRLLLGVDGQKEGDLGPREEIGPPTDSNSKAH